MLPAPQRPIGCAREHPLGGQKLRSKAPHSDNGGGQGRGRETWVLPGEDGLGVRWGPFISSHTGGWGLHASTLQPERRSADRPTCCHAPAAHLPPLAPGAMMRLPSAPTHTPLVLSPRGRESGERQTEWQTRLTSFPAGPVPGPGSSRKASKLPRTASC